MIDEKIQHDDSDESAARARKIKEIKEAVRRKNEQFSADSNVKSEAYPETAESSNAPAETVKNEPSECTEKTQAETSEAFTENSFDEDWEKSLADKISRHSGAVRKKNNSTVTVESILAELDGLAETGNAQDTDGADEQNISGNIIAQPEAVPDIVPEEIQAEAAAFSEKSEKSASKKKKKSKKKKTLKQSLRELFPEKGDSKGECVRKIVFLISCTAIVVFGSIVGEYYIGNWLTQRAYEEVLVDYPEPVITKPPVTAPTEPEILLTPMPEAQRLLNINSEVAGVIDIPGTNVNYPVMQSDDLEKYLNLTIMGKEARAGSLFLDYRNNFDRVVDGKLVAENSDIQVIYGHNMANGMMFGDLKNYKNYDYYYGEHPVINLNSNYYCYTYKIFAFFILDAKDKTDTAFDCWNKFDFDNEEDFFNYVNEAKRRTLRTNDVDMKYGDKLLVLSTCNTIFGQDGPGRFIVMARLVREGEDPYEGTQNSQANPNIKWPNLYYDYNSNQKYDPEAFVPYNAAPEETTENTEELG